MARVHEESRGGVFVEAHEAEGFLDCRFFVCSSSDEKGRILDVHETDLYFSGGLDIEPVTREQALAEAKKWCDDELRKRAR